MQIALAQLNPLVGDLEGNAARLLGAARQATELAGGVVLVATPELSLWGYPPRDLLLQPSLIALQQRLLDGLVQQLGEQAPAARLLVGIAEDSGDQQLPNLFNAVALVTAQDWRVVCRKQLLPSYDVFDERRYFKSADQPALLELDGLRLGLTICEDLWVDDDLLERRLAGPDPIAALQPMHPDLLLNLSASPFGRGKLMLRQQLAQRAAERLGCPLVYVNQVGGNDELVFDGAGFVVDAAGAVVLQQAWSAEDLSVWEPAASQGTADRPVPAKSAATLAPQGSPTIPPAPGWSLFSRAEPEAPEQLLRALVLGVRDYARKCGFGGALLGLSGGIDSALVAVIACAALGAERVRALRMPSPWSSEGSLTDAADLAARLGLELSTLPIAPLMEAMEGALTPALGGPPAGLTAENLQSRLRGTLLMAVANQEGQLLLSTGNKSELAVGYCTLYGDMNGGLAVIGDLYKTTVFRLCAWLDAPESAGCRAALGLPAAGELIGAAIRTKPPSAELRPDQRDSDSLPDYAVLDPILKALVEELASPEQLVAAGADAALVERVATLLRRAEFKRRQAPPALKVSFRAFGSGWRFPIAAGRG